MRKAKITVKFDDVSPDVANRWAENLRSDLLYVDGITPERKRDDPNTQDFGTILSIILGSQAIVALIGCLQSWLERHQGASITIEDARGKIIVSGVTGAQAQQLVETLRKEVGE